MTQSTIQQLLTEQSVSSALLETDSQILNPGDMLEEALAESAGLEKHSFKLAAENYEESPSEGEFDQYQFFNQDQLSGMGQSDLDNLNPDNTEHLNKHGTDTDGLLSPVAENTVAFLLEGTTAASSIGEDEITQADLDDLDDDED